MKVELEGFKFLGHIGTGGMASVWKARQLSLDRDVAVKVLSPKFAMTEADVGRFLSEARVAAKLKHPGIVQVYDAISQGGVHCFIMEYVAGYTVGQWMQRSGKLPESEAMVIAECVAQALNYAWKQHKMVHCDIKPDNVMVDADGTIKLTDMGLSRMYGVMRHGASDEVFGTPVFMAPEQIQGKAVDCRTDMYSLGAMLYYLVSGVHLFAGEPDEKVMEQQNSGQVTHLKKLRPELSIAFCDFVERLLAKAPEGRYASWDAVLSDIAAVSKKWPLPSGVPELNVGTMRSDAALKRPKSVRTRNAVSHREEGVTSPFRVFLVLLLLVGIVGGSALLLVWYVIPADFVERVKESLGFKASQKALVEAQAAALQQTEATASERKQLVDVVMGPLEEEAHRLLEVGQYAKAISLFMDYDGEFVDATAERRMRRVAEINALYAERSASERMADQERQMELLRQQASERSEEEEEERVAQEEEERIKGRAAQAERITSEVYTVFSNGGLAAAHQKMEALIADNPDVADEARVTELAAILSEAVTAEENVARSLAAQRGRSVTLRMKAGPIAGTVGAVDMERGTFELSQAMGSATVDMEHSLADLALAERVQRMGTGDTHGIRLARVLAALDEKQYNIAREQMGPLPVPFKQRLLRMIPFGN